jgi:hypothetical protein
MHARHHIKNTLRLGIFTLLLATLVVSLPAAAVYAQPSGGGSNTSTGGGGGGSNTAPAKTFTLQNPLKVDSLGGLIEAFVEVFSYIVILFAVLAIIYVGLQYILARGNSEEITKRTDQLKWIVIGVAVVIGARIIVSVVINTLGASGVVDQSVIRSANNAIDGK